MPFLRFIGFSIVRAWQGFWRNAMMSLAATATVILMLVLLSALFIVISGLNHGLEFIERKVAVTARLEDNLTENRLQRLIDSPQYRISHALMLSSLKEELDRGLAHPVEGLRRATPSSARTQCSGPIRRP